MAHCKDCIHFNVCEAFGKTVKFPVDDGVCLYFAKDTNVTTNADRIRAMSDEELAKILNAFTSYFDECNRSEDDIDCHDCELFELCSLWDGKAIEWLQQPPKGE